MKIVIGLIGENGAGKETVGDIIMECVGKWGYAIVRRRFSDILNETLRNWGIEPNRLNLQKLAQAMDSAYGPGTLTRAVKRLFENNPADIVIADGVRWPTDEKMIRSFPINLIVYITAEPKVRYERLKARKEKAGEGTMTYERFLDEGKASNEIYIPAIGARANVRMENNSGLEELHEKVAAFLASQFPDGKIPAH